MRSQHVIATKHRDTCQSGWQKRRDELWSLSPLRLAGLIIDHGLILDEECDPVEMILNFEFDNITGDNCVPQSKNRQRKVLVVDDDRDIVDAVEHALNAMGLKVVVARDGNDGLAKVESEQPDLIILDMMMPKRSGYLVLESLRRNHAEVVPVIMITANEGKRHEAYANELGVSDYLRKPFPMERLVDSVEQALP